MTARLGVIITATIRVPINFVKDLIKSVGAHPNLSLPMPVPM